MKKEEWMLNEMEMRSKRYIEAEQFIMEISEMPWYKRFFLNKKILLFLKGRSKYDF